MCTVTLYADDTALYFSSRDPSEMEQNLEQDLSSLKQWFDYNKVTLNAKKTKFMQFSGSKKKAVFSDVQVRLNDTQIEHVSVFKYLGLWLDETLSFKEHIGQISKKVNKRFGMLSMICKNCNQGHCPDVV